MLQVFSHLCDYLPDSLRYVHACFVLGSPGLDPALQMCLSNAEQSGMITPIDMLATFFCMQSRLLLSSFAARAHFWLMIC